MSTRPEPSMPRVPGPMNERLKPYTPRHVANIPVEPTDRPLSPSRPTLAHRLFGWTLLAASVGLVSCQSLFVP